jgi:hypothetical protein
MPQRRTAGEMLLAVRDNLDERNPAFWLDDQLYRYLTRAADLVHTEVRKLKANYHTTSLRADQGTVNIFGLYYDTANLRLQPTGAGVLLPPDLLELTLVEVITSGLEWVTFDLSKRFNHPEFRALRRLTTSQPPVAFLGCVMAENLLTIAPKSTVALDLAITYVTNGYIVSGGVIPPGGGTPIGGAIATSFTASSDLFTMPFPLYAAVEQWATAFAHLQDRNPQMAGEYERRAMATVQRAIGSDARQTQDPEFVQDYDP